MTDTPAPAPDKPWFEGQSAEVIGYLSNRGLDKLTPSEVALKAIEFHRNAETKLGVPADQLARLPKDINDTATRDALWTKLGRPAEAKGYEFDKVPGVDAKFAEWAAPIAHKLGLSKDQAVGFVQELAKVTNGLETENEKAAALRLEADKQELANEWGAQANAHTLMIEKATKALGLTDEQIGGIQTALGFKDATKLFLKLGAKMGEDVFIDNPGSGGGKKLFTKEGAIERISQLTKDPVYTSAYLNGDAAKLQEMTDLHRVAYG